MGVSKVSVPSKRRSWHVARSSPTQASWRPQRAGCGLWRGARCRSKPASSCCSLSFIIHTRRCRDAGLVLQVHSPPCMHAVLHKSSSATAEALTPVRHDHRTVCIVGPPHWTGCRHVRTAPAGPPTATEGRRLSACSCSDSRDVRAGGGGGAASENPLAEAAGAGQCATWGAAAGGGVAAAVACTESAQPGSCCPAPPGCG